MKRAKLNFYIMAASLLKSPTNKYVLALSLLIQILFVLSPALAEPGSEQVLEQKTTEAQLYLSEVHRDPSGRVTVKLAWIPEDLLTRCLGKSLDYCRKLDNCTLFPDAQKCEPNLSNCKHIIRPECKSFGISLKSLKPLVRKTQPNKILEVMPYQFSKELLPLLFEWQMAPQDTGMRKVAKLDRRYSIRARVHWELWSNGENIRIMKLLK